jgi:hypothetical protein
VFIKKMSLFCAIMAIHHHSMYAIDVTAIRLHNDTFDIKKCILERVHSDLKKAKRFGKGAAHFFSGISHYAFDAIPFEFFTDSRAIEAAFKRLEEGAEYIQETKEVFKRNYMGNKKKLNQSHLAEFLYNRVVDRVTVSDEQKAILRRDPLKMDEYVRRGIVKREEYMYYTLLNFVVRYYLEHELKHK